MLYCRDRNNRWSLVIVRTFGPNVHSSVDMLGHYFIGSLANNSFSDQMSRQISILISTSVIVVTDREIDLDTCKH